MYIFFFFFSFLKKFLNFRFWVNDPQYHRFLTICRIIKQVRAKNLEATLLFVDFSKAFDFILSGKMEQMLLAFGLPQETVIAIMLLYKNIKIKVFTPDKDKDFFNIVAGVLQGNTLASYLFVICLDCIL